jgi:hypothetical protein
MFKNIISGFRTRKILRKAISLTYPFSATHKVAARDVFGYAVPPNHPSARSFCAIGYIERATHLCGYDIYPHAQDAVDRVAIKNNIDWFLGTYFDTMQGTAEDARKMFEKAL